MNFKKTWAQVMSDKNFVLICKVAGDENETI